MSKEPRGRTSRIWRWSGLFALWCVLWPGLILIASPPRRDIVVALVERAARMPIPLVFASLAIGAFGLMALTLFLRRRLDAGNDALSAICWSLTSRGLVALIALVALLALGAAVLSTRFGVQGVGQVIGSISIPLARFVLSWWWLALLIVVGGLAISLPFCFANPDTLQRDRLQQWWRPSWPGTPAVVVAPLLWIGWPALVDAAMSWLPEGGVLSWAAIPLAWLLVAFGELIALALWLNRSAKASTRDAIRRMATGHFIRRYLGLRLGWCAFALWVAVPLCIPDLFAIYIAPELDRALQSGQLPESASMRALLALSDVGMNDTLRVSFAAISLFIVLSTGRLLVRLGIAPPAAIDPRRPD